ncbi:acetyl-CoA synthetase-like protein [Polyplosphaeria fusca]|uniref:Acetyl-CoA synthetase-like protein n=1 Tax=Polyplosphaeria fusca TaxID=682080 RepID=A0A9P4QIZ4_9PLEO|nr:acetyl-CoA synthetase-like protein [Polyplosphaeria fusca]
MAGVVEQLDSLIADLLAGWNIYTTLLLGATAGFVAWVIYEAQDADTHPLLLARQAQASYVRQPGESAAYRSPEVPHGYVLRSGLGVKVPGAPLYSAGKNGDLRDIWRRVTGEIPLEKNVPHAPASTTAGPGTATIMTVFGSEGATEHSIAELTKEISVIGQHLKDHGAKKVALYLPNSVEFLAALFAAAFYDFTPILIPYNQPHPTLIELLAHTGADSLIAEAGSIPLADVSKGVSRLRSVVWTVEKTSRHMDWNEVPEGIGGKIDVSVWHQLVQDQKNGKPELPQGSGDAPDIIFLWQEAPGKPAEVVQFTQQNIAAATGALISALPSPQRISPSDTFLPADSFTQSYTLCLTLAALFSHATLVINSVAGPGVDLTLASRKVAPTITVISAETAAKLHSTTTASVTGGLQKLAHSVETKSLTAGRLPTDSFISRVNAPTRAAIGTTPGKLRLLFVSERAGHNTPPMSSDDLSDLRIFAKARVIYALTAAKVAGAVAQTNIYDYRRGVTPANKHSHFGVPLSSLEIKLKDTPVHKTTDDGPFGEITVKGPAVAGGEASLGVNGTFREDHTLAYI